MTNIILEWSQTSSGVKYGDLLEAYGVSIGLYLALGIIQAIAGFRLGRIRRRIDTLAQAVNSRKMSGQYDEIRKVSGNLSNIELKLDSFFNILFLICLFMLFVAMSMFSVAILNQEYILFRWSLYSILLYLDWLPFLIFICSSAYIAMRCRPLELEVRAISERVSSAVFAA